MTEAALIAGELGGNVAGTYRPTTRVLTMLELLQSHGRMTGRELARRLEVHPRTVRRYVEILQDLGVPVVSDRGRYGAYRLRPGFKLPPLMLGGDEALAVVLGLLTARRLGLAVAAPAIEGALAKIDRVLPDAIRQQVGAVQDTVVLNLRAPAIPPPSGMVTTLSSAARQRRRVWMRYQGRDGAEIARTVDPYGTVYHAGAWYMAGYCHLRRDMRTFRLDRIREAVAAGEAGAFAPPAGFDCLDYVLRSIASAPRAFAVTVTLALTLDEARSRIPLSLGMLEAVEGGVRLRCSVDSLDWMAAFLAGLECQVAVHEPSELRAALRRLADRLLDMAAEHTTQA